MVKGINPVKLFCQDGKGKEPHNGPDRRKSERYDLSEEGRAIVAEITERIKGHHFDNCFIPKEARQHAKHAVLAVQEIGEGSIPYGINKSKDVIKRSHDAFENQDESKRTATNSAIKYVVGALLMLLAGALLMKFKGGG